MWLLVLSDQLPIVALVSAYPTNQLIGHRPSFQRPPKRALLGGVSIPQAHAVLSAISRRYSSLKGRYPCVTHPSATPSRAETQKDVRLACVRHAASVYPEPGSNSPSNCICTPVYTGAKLPWYLSDPGQVLACVVSYLACSQILDAFIDRNCSCSLTVAVLLSTLQLSKY